MDGRFRRRAPPLPGLALLFAVGCATTGFEVKSLPPFEGTRTKNVAIHRMLDVGEDSEFEIEAAMDVYEITDDCGQEYKGSVMLDRAIIPVGLPAGVKHRLVFRFVLSTDDVIRVPHVEKLFLPERGHRYEIRARYVDAVYGVRIFDTGSSREIDLRSRGECFRG